MPKDRMFDLDSFDELKDVSEVKSAVQYFSHNEIKFRKELEEEGLEHSEVQSIIRHLWNKLLNLCKKYKYSDYIVKHKEGLYSKAK
jgi:hypothetical protein